MATVYTRTWAIEKAIERRDRDHASYAVWQHIRNDGDYIVKSSDAAAPRDFRRIATAWDDGSFTEYQG